MARGVVEGDMKSPTEQGRWDVNVSLEIGFELEDERWIVVGVSTRTRKTRQKVLATVTDMADGVQLQSLGVLGGEWRVVGERANGSQFVAPRVERRVRAQKRSEQDRRTD